MPRRDATRSNRLEFYQSFGIDIATVIETQSPSTVHGVKVRREGKETCVKVTLHDHEKCYEANHDQSSASSDC
jgi:hypothetical protein